MALLTLINKPLKWNISEAILLLAVVFELVMHLHGMILEYPPKIIKLVKNRTPLNISVTYNKHVCGEGYYLPITIIDPYKGDIRVRDDEQEVTNFKTDVLEKNQKYQNNPPNSQNNKWCWSAFKQFDPKTLIFDWMFIKPHFGLNTTQTWWCRGFPLIHTGDDTDGGIVYSNKRIWPMIENMTIISEWNGPLETLTAPFPVFKCAFTGWWRMSDGDRTTLNDDYYVYEVVMHEVVRTQSKEYNVIDGQELTLKIKPGFSEIINCEVASTASLRYQWVWRLKTRQDTSFRTIDARKFEIPPKTTAAAYTKQERLWDDVDKDEMTSCKVQVTTGKMGFVMDKNLNVEGSQHYNGSQLECMLVYKYKRTKTYSLRTYTMNLEYDWAPADVDDKARKEGSIDFTPDIDCTPFKIAFGIFTFLSCLALGVSFKYYRIKGALYKEKWRFTRIPRVDPKTFRKLLRKYIREMKSDKSQKSRFSVAQANSKLQETDEQDGKNIKGNKNRSCYNQTEKENVNEMGYTESENATPKENRNDPKKRENVNGKKDKNESHFENTESESESIQRNSKGSCFDPTKDPSKTWTPYRGAGSFAYMNSAQYYADLRACLEDDDQSYDDKGNAGLRSRHKDYYTSFQDAHVSYEDVVGSSSDEETESTSGSDSSTGGDTIDVNRDKQNLVWTILGRIGLRKRHL